MMPEQSGIRRASLKDIILRNAFALKVVRSFRRHVNNKMLRNAIEVLVSPVGEIKWLLKSVPEEKQRYNYRLGVVAIIKDEASYIDEWISFHRLAGFEKIILYDNGSTDGTKDSVSRYVTDGILDYYWYPGRQLQCDVYNDAVNRYMNEIQYIAFIDIDEYLFPCQTGDTVYGMIDKLMKRDTKAGGCVVNWLCYGSNGYDGRPMIPVIQAYTRRGEASFSVNRHYKSIVNPRRVFSFICPHYPQYIRGTYAVDTTGTIVTDETKEGDYTLLRINHYFTKSKEEYVLKMNRGKADRADKRDMSDFYRHDVNDIEDRAAIRFVEEVRRLASDKQDDSELFYEREDYAGY